MTTHRASARTASRLRQRGLSFVGVVMVGVFAVAAFAIVGQSVPIFLEMFEIQKAIDKASRSEITVPAIRASFDRAAAIDSINTVSGKDLDITKRGEKIVVGVKYSREIALAGPAHLVYRFDLQSK